MKEKIKFIIAESEHLIAADLQIILENAGHKVMAIASSGEETIEKVKEFNPDIVILDIYISGGMDGKSTAKKIQEFSKTSIMFYSTCKDVETIKDIQSINNGSEINLNRLLFGMDEENQIISNVEKVISDDN